MHNITQSSIIVLILWGVLIGTAPSTVTAQAESAPERASIVVDESAQATQAEMLVSRLENSWPWYVTRASGIVAGVVLVLLMLSGIGFITGTTYRFLEPLTGWATHRALGIILTLSLALHMSALYFDHFVPFSLVDLFVPFASEYQPMELLGVTVGSPYVAMGVVAFYLILLIVIVSLIWVERKTQGWKLVHLMSYVVMALVFFHALMIGTDVKEGLPRYLWIVLGIGVLIASLTRLWRAYTL